jgi:hypothetical protein
MDYLQRIVEKQKISKGDDGFAIGARARIKELGTETAKLKERYQIINDSIELLK